MKLGFNSVLFGGHAVETAFQYASLCGYDGLEISAIQGMSHHMIGPDKLKDLSAKFNIPILAMEQPSQDPAMMEAAMQAAVAMGCPIINCGPGGKSDDEASFQQSIESLGKLTERAKHYGLTLCVKAHVGAAIYDTPTTLRALLALPDLGLDMDPSHIHRAGENPVEALAAVVSRIRHVHIRDCKGRQQNPGKPEMQANGRGDIDLLGYIRVLHQSGYTGPVDLEVIGAKEYDIPRCVAIAAEARGHMQACLQACGAR